MHRSAIHVLTIHGVSQFMPKAIHCKIILILQEGQAYQARSEA
jgi:hypothetical protein